MSVELFQNFDVIFLDFDGVIKDSVEVKSDAFEQLFTPIGKDFAKRVRKHHETNGGMSRFEKLNIYIDWSGQTLTQELLDDHLAKFSKLVKQKVIDSDWVPGIIDYFKKKIDKPAFYLITATPQTEIEEILTKLNIRHIFREIVGAPIKKKNAIKKLLKKFLIEPEKALMVGDSFVDYNAAKLNNVQFVLRRTNLNKDLQNQLDCRMIDNFL